MKITVRRTLVVLLLAFSLIPVVVLSTAGYLVTERMVGRLVARHNRTLAGEARERADGLVRRGETLVGSLEGSSVFLDLGPGGPGPVELPPEVLVELERIFRGLLGSHGDFMNAYFATVDGEFVMVGRREGALDVRRTRRTASGDLESFWAASVSAEPAGIDPRPFVAADRPWYPAAMASVGVAWSTPYVFSASKKVGVTASRRVTNRRGEPVGVVGVDLSLEDLSRFLGQFDLGPQGTAFILTDDGFLVAWSDRDPVVRQDGDGAPSLGRVARFDDPRFHPALKGEGATYGEEGLVHEVAGEEYHTHLVPYENGPWRWSVGVATPRSHFTEGLDFLRPFTVGLALATALLATALALVCSLLVTRPLENLAGSAQRVRGGELDVDVEVYQRPREIEELSLSFRNMVKGLHEQFFMRRYISGATRAMIARSTGHQITDQEARGTRTEATVLFADIRGFTSFSEKHRPEEVIEVLNRYLALETECVDRHGGIVDKFIGDEVMALFLGAGREPEAVRAALEIQAGIAGITAKRREAGLEPVEVGIGIQSGMVLMGNMGSEARMDYTAVGDVVNVASRLQKLAQGGQVVVSRDVADRLDVRFEKTFLEAIPIRGRQAPVDVFRVTAYRQPP